MKLKHFLHHLLIPRESNNHRPKLLHHDTLFFIIALFVFVGGILGTVHTKYPQVLGVSSDISTQDLLTITNQKRQENGQKPLNMDSQLTSAAQAKAAHMFANNYWAHIAPDGTTPWFFIKNAGYEYLYAGENLARGFTTAQAVVDAWMASPTHRENMLSPNYDDVGFAVQSGTLTGSDTILVVEEFGRRYGGTQAQVAPAQTTEASPTPAVIAVVTKAPSPTATPVPPTPTPQVQSQTEVASAVNNPLVDGRSLTKTIAYGVLFLFLAVLILDAVIIERKKISRVVAHNLDHIIFLGVILAVIIIVGGGIIK